METDKINGRLPIDRLPVILAIINNIKMKYTAWGQRAHVEAVNQTVLHHACGNRRGKFSISVDCDSPPPPIFSYYLCRLK